MVKYEKTKIYKLVNDVDDLFYVGSTTIALYDRKAKHHYEAKKYPDRKVYEHFNKIGWGHVKIILIENFPCKTRDEMVAREYQVCQNLKPQLNTYASILTEENFKQQKKKWNDVYRLKNYDRIQQYNKEHYRKLKNGEIEKGTKKKTDFDETRKKKNENKNKYMKEQRKLKKDEINEYNGNN